MKNKRYWIQKDVEELFGELGIAKGQFEIYDDRGVCEVINDSGGIREIITANSPTDLLAKLDAIKTYLQWRKRYEA